MLGKTGTPQVVINSNSGRHTPMFVAKDSMSKRLFGWTKSFKLKCDKQLVTDAAVLEENDRNAAGDSSQGTQSTTLSIVPLSPELGFRQHSDNTHNMAMMRPNNSLIEPPNTPNGSLSLSQMQQNVYQISHASGVHIGSTYQINNVMQSSPSDRQSSGGDMIPKTRSIDAMMTSNERVNENIMDVISTHLGENWRCLFRNLGFTDGQIDQMKEDYYINGVKEVIYRLLLDYSRNNDDASLGHITRTLWKLGFKEVVKILKKHYKRGDLVQTEEDSGSRGGGCGKGKSVD